MTDYASMTIDNLIAYRDQWPVQRTEWNRAELALQKRLAVKYAFLDLAEELRDEGIVLIEQTEIDEVKFLVDHIEDRALELLVAAPQKEEAQ